MKSLLFLKQKKWKSFSIFLFFQLITVLSFAQVQVSGKVTGPEGEGLPSISVTIRNTTLGATTDVNGTYNISGSLQPGNYTLIFTGIG